MLPTHWTPEKVRTRLTTVTVNELNQSTQTHLGRTLSPKRTTAYKESKPPTGQAKT